MKKLFALTLTLLLASSLFAQADDPVLFEIDTLKIHRSEFLKEFLRSQGISPDAPKTACTYEKRKAITDYADLFLNYRTKLYDAYNEEYHLKKSLVKELKSYRDELAQPYLMDSATMNQILHEAYERNHYSLRASHILVKCKAQASPADTVFAYQTAMELYNRVTKGGEDFAKVAAEYNAKVAKSEMKGLPSDKPDEGDLGYFTVFDMVYPFESGAYSLNVGDISLPVRSAYGYHIIKLSDKCPFFGHTSIQHIWVSTESNPDYAAAKINDAYSKLQDGDKFAVVAQNYSDDTRSALNGGLLPDMSLRQIPAEYVNVISSLTPGEYSKPFQTSFGWHIVRLVTKDMLPPFEEMVPFYKQRMARDIRSKKPTETYIAQCKERYHFVDYTQEFEKVKGKKVAKASLDNAVNVMTDSVFRKHWHFADSMVVDNRPLFAIDGKTYGIEQLLLYIEESQKLLRGYDFNTFVYHKYQEFIDLSVLSYADARLETEYPEFGELVDEYRQGLMIFSYNDKHIWGRSLRDSLGLVEFYNLASAQKSLDNPDDDPYFWGERAHVNIFTLDSAALAPAKALKLAQKGLDKNYLFEQIDDLLKEKQNKHVDSVWTIREDKLIEKDAQSILSGNDWHRGVLTLPGTMAGTYRVVVVRELLYPSLKALNDARGYYINDYQNYLESELIRELRKKYHVVLHQDVLDETTY